MARTEPDLRTSDVRELMLGQLSYYRATLLMRLAGLGEDALRQSVLPSGWSPLMMLKHLAYVERRWMQWGFEGEAVPDPWGDNDPATRQWALVEDDSLASLSEFLTAVSARTEQVARHAELTGRGRLGGRFDADPPTLGWILLHLIQEYARHVGQLDVVRELVDGETGE